MDEILRRNTRPQASIEWKESPRRKEFAAEFRAQVLDAADVVQERVSVLKRTAMMWRHKLDHAVSGRKLLGPLPYLAAAGIAAAALVIGTVYTPSYVVSVDGVDLGVVAEQAVFEEAIERVEARASSILGYDYTMDRKVEYTFALTKKGQFSPVGAFETYLFQQVGEVMKTHVLSVNGEVVGAASEAELDSILETLAAPYVTEDTISVEYVDDVEITYQYISSDILQDLNAIEELLSSDTIGETTYEVVAGDTYSGIAYANDMKLDELMALNPEASLERLMVGDILTISRSVPYLSIRTVDAVTYTQSIDYPVEEVEDDSMYQGDTKVLTAGAAGEELVTANVAYVNGCEESREITSTETLTEPVTQVVAVGTKERPKTMPTGSFQWPLYGTITSRFGYRSIFGTYSFHSGMDIATSYGAAIAAADGGTVIWSGYKGSYGNLVILDHGNGLQTYYGHCSSLLVSAGDQVYKGQIVGRVGSTGRSTGNHCHFEVKLNGTSVNPLSYLP